MTEKQEEKIVAGSVVQLKSGGEKMTVQAINSDGEAFCTWMLKDGKLEHAQIELAALQLEGPVKYVGSL